MKNLSVQVNKLIEDLNASMKGSWLTEKVQYNLLNYSGNDYKAVWADMSERLINLHEKIAEVEKEFRSILADAKQVEKRKRGAGSSIVSAMEKEWKALNDVKSMIHRITGKALQVK
jgi:hypothetical protein